MPATGPWEVEEDGKGLLDALKPSFPEALEEIKAMPIRWDRDRFAFWLRQDFPFVEALYRYQVGLLREAPQAHRAPLVQALLATVEELDWLLAQGTDPGAEVHPVRREYIRLLEELEGLAYPYRLVFLFPEPPLSGGLERPRGGGGPLAGAFRALVGPGVPGGALRPGGHGPGGGGGTPPGGPSPLPGPHPGNGEEGLGPSPVIPQPGFSSALPPRFPQRGA